jgi:sugar/nucleoside kinase (ribokinase family)
VALGGRSSPSARPRLETLFEAVAGLHVVVLGDFFLDRYLEIDPALEERSLETGLPAHQVVAVRESPGGAGNVALNLAALGVGRVEAVGLVGDDGDAWTLRRALAAMGVVDALVVDAERSTAAYLKPVVPATPGEGGRFRRPSGRPPTAGPPGREGERMDIRTRRAPLPVSEEAIIARLGRPDACLVVDQLPRFGLLTPRLIETLAALQARVLVDSRFRLPRFRAAHLKGNRAEAERALGPGDPLGHARALAALGGRAAFVTCGAEGIAVGEGDSAEMIPAPRAEGPVDPVGAGDTVSAALLCGLCGGLSPREAARFAVAAAAVTVGKIGTTGTATRAEIADPFTSSA